MCTNTHDKCNICRTPTYNKLILHQFYQATLKLFFKKITNIVSTKREGSKCNMPKNIKYIPGLFQDFQFVGTLMEGLAANQLYQMLCTCNYIFFSWAHLPSLCPFLKLRNLNLFLDLASLCVCTYFLQSFFHILNNGFFLVFENVETLFLDH